MSAARATVARSSSRRSRSRAPDGYPRIYLEVDDDNTVARRLYESSGFQTTTTYGYYVAPL